MTVRDARGSNVAENDPDSVPSNLEEQLRIYDLLPKEYKVLIDSLPVKQDMREVKEAIRQFGALRGLELIRKVYEEKFPGWKEENNLKRKRGIRNGKL